MEGSEREEITPRLGKKERNLHETGIIKSAPNQQRSFATPRVCTAQHTAQSFNVVYVSVSPNPDPEEVSLIDAIDAIDIRTWLLCHQLADARNVCRDRRQEDKPACLGL